MRVRIGAGLALIALAGCHGASDNIVPWRPTAPPKPNSPAVAVAPPCRATDLHARLYLQGATGSLLGGITVHRIGRSPCSLTGHPSVRLLGPAGEPARLRLVRVKPPSQDDGWFTPPLASLRALGPAERVWLFLQWRNWCPPGTTATTSGEPPTGLVLGLASGDELRIPLRSAPRCDAPRYPTGVSIGPYRPSGHEPAHSTKIPLRPSFDGIANPEAKFGTPELQAARGGVLRYRIALTNRSPKPFAFHTCPIYVEKAFTLRYREAYVLNCKDAGTFGPGDRKVFAMELHVPSDARLGRNSLVWELGPHTFDPPWVPAAILVTP